MKWQSINKIEFAITTHCNANCPLCMRTDSITGKKIDSLPLTHMPIEDYKNILNQLDNSWQIYLCGDWGDPMMHPDISEILEYTIGHKNFTVCLDTNGGLRNQEFFKNIAKQYKDKLWINFSIDGFDEATNSKYRIGVDFDRCLENIIAYSKESPWLSVWQMLIFDYNYFQIDAVAEFCKQNKIYFDFKLNRRRWTHRVESEGIEHFVLGKQEEYKDLMYENSL